MGCKKTKTKTKARIRKYPDGGKVQKPKRNLRAESDSLTKKYSYLPWVKRYNEDNKLSIPDVFNPGSGKTSSHGLMYSTDNKGQAMIYPRIVQQGDSLIDLKDKAYDYAKKSNTFMYADSTLADFYSKDGLIDHTEEYPNGGKVAGKDKSQKFDVNNLDLYESLNEKKAGTIFNSLENDPASQELFLKNFNQIVKPEMPWTMGERGGIGVDWNLKQPVSDDVRFSKFRGYQNKPLYTKWTGETPEFFGSETDYSKAYETWSATQEGEISEYSLGGIAGSALAGAGSGALYGGFATAGPGAIPGAVLGLLGGFGKGLVSHFKDKKQERLLDNSANQAQIEQKEQHVASMQDYQTGTTFANKYAPTFAMGGQVYDSYKSPIKIEKKEKVIEPDGDIIQANVGTHTSGNDLTVNVDPDSYVFSDTLKTSTGRTFAEELDIPLKDIERIDKNKKGFIPSKNSALLMSNRSRAKIDELQAENEQERLKMESRKYKRIDKNEVPEMFWGGPTGDTSFSGRSISARTGPFSGDWRTPAKVDTTLASTITQATDESQKGWLGNNWQGLVGLGSSLLAPAFNIAQGLQDPIEHVASDYYNPYRAEIRSTMRDRRFNIDPILEQNVRTQAAYNRNIQRGAATSSGQMLSSLGAGLAGRMRADAQVYAQKSNIENQYLAEQAQMDYELGNQMAGANWQTDMANLQNIAAQQGMFGTGLSQVGQAGQMWSLMQGQRERDALLANAYGEGFPATKFAPDILKFLNYYKQGSTR